MRSFKVANCALTLMYTEKDFAFNGSMLSCRRLQTFPPFFQNFCVTADFFPHEEEFFSA